MPAALLLLLWFTTISGHAQDASPPQGSETQLVAVPMTTDAMQLQRQVLQLMQQIEMLKRQNQMLQQSINGRQQSQTDQQQRQQEEQAERKRQNKEMDYERKLAQERAQSPFVIPNDPDLYEAEDVLAPFDAGDESKKASLSGKPIHIHGYVKDFIFDNQSKTVMMVVADKGNFRLAVMFNEIQLLALRIPDQISTYRRSNRSNQVKFDIVLHAITVSSDGINFIPLIRIGSALEAEASLDMIYDGMKVVNFKAQ